MSELLNNYILNKKNQLTNISISNLSKTNNKLNFISYKNLLEIKIKELNIYNKILSLSISNIKKILKSKIDFNLSLENNFLLNTTNENNENSINLIERKEKILLNKNKKKQNFNKY